MAIITFIIAEFLKAYGFCKAKFYFDLKFISISKFLKYYGLFGSFICILGSLISTYTKCTSYYDNRNIKYICRFYEGSDNYFDNFKMYFDRFWNKETTSKNICYCFLFILKNLFLCATCFFTFCIIKNLSPEYYVCANSMYYLIVDILKFIGYLISHENEFNKYDVMSEIISIIGASIYLEFIELNFFHLNYDSKRNISIRSISELTDFNFNLNGDNEEKFQEDY